MRSNIIYIKQSNNKAARERIKEYKKNSYETMLRITEISHTIAEKYDLSPTTLLICEISVYEHDDVVHCIYNCVFKKLKNSRMDSLRCFSVFIMRKTISLKFLKKLKNIGE